MPATAIRSCAAGPSGQNAAVSPVDLVIVVAVAGFALLGWYRGFLLGVMSLAGFVLGMAVATRIVPMVTEQGASSPYTPMVATGTALLLISIASSAMHDLGKWAQARWVISWRVVADSLAGSVLWAVLALGIAWAMAATVMSMPQARSLREPVTSSKIVRTLNRRLPPSGPLLHALSRYDPFPGFAGPSITAAAPSGELPRTAAFRDAADSVVRVTGSACGFSITGSGWVAAPGIVVTNAHVVAGQDDTEVMAFRSRRRRPARVIYLDRRNDLALLSARRLDRQPLELVRDEDLGKDGGDTGAVMGFPENGPFAASPARFGRTQLVRAPDAWGEGTVRRSVTSFSGRVLHGNSGGPIVDADGRVITTVFAAATDSSREGGYGVPNSLVRTAVADASPDDRAVSTGSCIG